MESDLILVENIFHRKPHEFFQVKKLGKPMVLIASESLAVLKSNRDSKVLSLFDHVFTYDDKLLRDDSSNRISKFNYTFSFPKEVVPADFDRNSFSALCNPTKDLRINMSFIRKEFASCVGLKGFTQTNFLYMVKIGIDLRRPWFLGFRGRFYITDPETIVCKTLH